MTNIDRWFCFVVCVLTFGVGFFTGGIVEQTKRIQNISDNKKVKEKFIQSKDLINFWEHGYMKRDSALQKISTHKDCTFELKSIIGEIY